MHRSRTSLRSRAGRSAEPLESAERGPLLETYVFHELRAFMHDQRVGGELAYWRTASGTEVDFVWTHGKKSVAIEVKATARWRSDDGRALRELSSALRGTRCMAVYLGDRAMKDGDVDVLPVRAFLERLYRGDVIG